MQYGQTCVFYNGGLFLTRYIIFNLRICLWFICSGLTELIIILSCFFLTQQGYNVNTSSVASVYSESEFSSKASSEFIFIHKGLDLLP